MRICKTFFLLPLFILLSFPALSQKTDYYQGISLKTFRSEILFCDTLDFADLDLSRLNFLLFLVTNEIRTKNNLPVLEYSAELEKAAAMHSRDMVMHDFFSHNNPIDPTRKTPNDRAAKWGIMNPYIAENIAEDFGLEYQSGTQVYIPGKGKFNYKPDGEAIPPRTYLSLAESLLKRWMNSPEHRKNILSRDALQMGCGTYYFTDPEFNDMPTFMATQNFQWYEKIKRLQED